VLLAVEAMTLGYSVVKGRAYARAKMSALASLWKERGKIKEKRRRYSKLRTVSDRHLLGALRWNLEWKQLFGIVR